jgi:malonyl-CoA O-methyltransferase
VALFQTFPDGVEEWLDRAAMRRSLERAASAREGDPVAREVERRMAERLQYIKHAPERIVEISSTNGAGIDLLRARYPQAEIVSVRFSQAAAHQASAARPLAARARSLFSGGRQRFICADPAALPLAHGSCAMLWSNLTLASSADPVRTLREWHRVLAVNGLIMFSTYGPATLNELRAAFAATDTVPHVHPFVDMHDLGDALVANGFADPVMDMEFITLTYADVAALLADLRASGQQNAHASRRRMLTGRRRWQAMVGAYAQRTHDGRVPATFEIVYGHAWKAAPRVATDGRTIIRFERPPRASRAG